MMNGGTLSFFELSSGGQASITLNSGGVLQFTDYLPILARYHNRIARRVRYRELD